MDTLSIPFGLHAGTLDISADEWSGQPAVDFKLPMDDRLIAREHIPSLIEWLQGFLEETKPPLPTLPHAVIQAKMADDGTGRVLTRIPEREADHEHWVSADPGHSSDWFADADIASFEVLFPGVEA